MRGGAGAGAEGRGRVAVPLFVVAALAAAGCVSLRDGVPLVSCACAPVIDGVVDEAEWGKALAFAGEFVIDAESPADGPYPADIRLGLNATHVLLAVRLALGPNPSTTNETEYPDIVSLFFTPHEEVNEEALWFSLASFGETGGIANTGRWEGRWRLGWDPEEAWDARARVQEGSHTWEAAIPRERAVTSEGTMRIALMFQRQGPEPGRDVKFPFFQPRDVWPAEGYTPDANWDLSTWQVVDFARPQGP